ncbi:hypothetical protein MRB53_001748 [Persea americana]|uniref:Uncharacterized protein n=1 Tax=Persea americana TaxID=3435 RepID=A0ACC2MTJ3_PERAE|nr:hypothetical protein MRB53_001748 [Persea americana]
MAETEVTISSFDCLHCLAPLETPAEPLRVLLNACLIHISSSAAMADDSGFEILGALNCSASCACVCSCEPKSSIFASPWDNTSLIPGS